jgi:hypothetical protein
VTTDQHSGDLISEVIHHMGWWRSVGCALLNMSPRAVCGEELTAEPAEFVRCPACDPAASALPANSTDEVVHRFGWWRELCSVLLGLPPRAQCGELLIDPRLDIVPCPDCAVTGVRRLIRRVRLLGRCD